MGCAQSRGCEEMACLQHTRQESGFIVTRGTKLVAFLWTNTQHVSPCTSMWLLGRTSGTGLSTGRKGTVFSGGVCHLEPVWSTCGWAMSALIGIKALNPSLQGKKKNWFQLYAILEKAKQWKGVLSPVHWKRNRSCLLHIGFMERYRS